MMTDYDDEDVRLAAPTPGHRDMCQSRICPVLPRCWIRFRLERPHRY